MWLDFPSTLVKNDPSEWCFIVFCPCLYVFGVCLCDKHRSLLKVSHKQNNLWDWGWVQVVSATSFITSDGNEVLMMKPVEGHCPGSHLFARGLQVPPAPQRSTKCARSMKNQYIVSEWNSHWVRSFMLLRHVVLQLFDIRDSIIVTWFSLPASPCYGINIWGWKITENRMKPLIH